MKPDSTRTVRWFLIAFGFLLVLAMGTGDLITLVNGKHARGVIEEVGLPGRGTQSITLRVDNPGGQAARYFLSASTRARHYAGQAVEVIVPFSGNAMIYAGAETWIRMFLVLALGLVVIAIGALSPFLFDRLNRRVRARAGLPPESGGRAGG